MINYFLFRITLFFIVIMLLLGLGIAFSAAKSAKDEILLTRMQQMSSIKISKMLHINDYFEKIKYIMSSRTVTTKTTRFLWALDEGFEEFEDVAVDLDDAKKSLMEYYEKEYL